MTHESVVNAVGLAVVLALLAVACYVLSLYPVESL